MTSIEDLLRQGLASAGELIAALKISQPTLSRKINSATNILKIGKGKATRYALLREVGGKSSFPIYRIDEYGKASHAATLYPVWPGDNCAVENRDGDWQNFDGMPWYLLDMRPQGFIGRLWGRQIAEMLRLPEDIRLWTEKHTLLALSQWGDAMVGSLLVGEGSYRRLFEKEPDFRVSLRDKTETYQNLAVLSLSGEQVGSSAGGEQPKFGCLTEHPEKDYAHVLVKFSLGSENDNAERWADLLQAESLALEVLRARHFPASAAQVVFGDAGEIFLEVERFDRVGLHGRRGMISLEAVSAEFLGSRMTNWVDSAKELRQQKMINQACFGRICQLYAFGKLIANSDMHAGNLSFISPEQFPLELAPAYDMLPMAFAPGSSGNMRQNIPEIKLDTRLDRASWLLAQEWAIEFWRAVIACDTISEAFRGLARQMLTQVSGLTADINRLA